MKRRLTGTAWCASVLLIGAHCHAQTTTVLLPGVPHTATIRDGQVDRYRSAITGEVRVVVENLERGMLLTACEGDCRRPEHRLARTATWRAPEHMHSAVFAADQETIIELTPDTAVGPAGDYRVTLSAISATDPDYAGELAMSRGAELHSAYWWDGDDTLRAALDQFQIAIDEFKKIRNPARTADALYEQAMVHWDLDNFADAYDRLLEAESIWVGQNDRRGIASARNFRGLIQWHFGDALTAVRTESATVLFESVIALRSADDQKYFRAQALNNLGLVYQEQGRSRLAQQFFEDALTAASGDADLMMIDPQTFDFSSLDHGPWLDDALTMMKNLGWAYDRAANPGQAIRHYEQALKLAGRLDTPRLAAEIRSNYGALNYRIGKLEPALAQTLEALAYFRDVSRDEVWQAQVQNELGLIYFASGDNERAAVALEAALRIRTAKRHPIDRALTLRDLALLDLDAGSIDAALSRVNEAFSLIETGGEDLRISLATLHRLAGEAYLASGDIEQALHHDDEAVRLLDGHRGLARAISDRAWARHTAGDDPTAISDLVSAVRIASETDAIPDLVRAHTFLAKIYDGQDDFEQAASHAALAVSASNEIRAQIRHPVLLRDFSSVQQEAYDILLSSRIALGEYESAWILADDARARRFRELLRRTGADLQRLGATERKRFEDLSARISELGQQRTEFLASGHKDDADQARRELLPLTVELESLRVKAGEGTRTSAAQTSPTDIQALLGQRDVLLEFHFADAWAGVWAIRQDSVEFHELPQIEQIQTLVDQIRSALVPVGPPPDEQLRRLSELIFGARGVALANSERIIVVPDGPMYFVPLTILKDPESGFADPLIARREIVYAPSASAALELEERRPARGEGLAILADPVFNPDDERVRAVAQRSEMPKIAALDPDLTASRAYNARSGFARLRYTAFEAEAIKKSAEDMHVLVAMGTDANRDFVLNGSLDGFRYLHFATHGVLDIEEPSSSGLVLSGLTARGDPRPRFLRTADIVNLDLKADLVVLSGCDTGLGKVVRGEGLQSLSRAFFHAGAKTVVSSLWQVPDAATSALMSDFYKELLQDKVSPARALRLAQLEVSSNPRWRNPYFWSAFVIQGAWESRQH